MLFLLYNFIINYDTNHLFDIELYTSICILCYTTHCKWNSLEGTWNIQIHFAWYLSMLLTGVRMSFTKPMWCKIFRHYLQEKVRIIYITWRDKSFKYFSLLSFQKPYMCVSYIDVTIYIFRSLLRPKSNENTKIRNIYHTIRFYIAHIYYTFWHHVTSISIDWKDKKEMLTSCKF